MSIVLWNNLKHVPGTAGLICEPLKEPGRNLLFIHEEGLFRRPPAWNEQPTPETVQACRGWLRIYGRRQAAFYRRGTTWFIGNAIKAHARLNGLPVEGIASGSLMAAALLENYKLFPQLHKHMEPGPFEALLNINFSADIETGWKSAGFESNPIHHRRRPKTAAAR